ncbi:hypothetical protein [Sinobacterium norvegicum]|nr:hypothetical protein [Sinobacterium norvegicum]
MLTISSVAPLFLMGFSPSQYIEVGSLIDGKRTRQQAASQAL